MLVVKTNINYRSHKKVALLIQWYVELKNMGLGVGIAFVAGTCGASAYECHKALGPLGTVLDAEM